MDAAGNMNKKNRVFIVDDHPFVREGLTRRINREKDLAVCGEAEDVSTALQSIADAGPDIVITDLTFKHESGFTLIEDLLHKNRKQSILVLSMHDESVFAEKCLKAGAKGYIMKEEPPEKVLSAIRSVLQGDVYISDELQKKLLNRLIEVKKDDIKSPVEILGKREFEVYQLVGKGLTAREIAEKLNISNNTVENYVKRIKNKLNLKRSREIILHASKYFV
jgi:RNA polymerase sigma factor (sigma-70 family)